MDNYATLAEEQKEVINTLATGVNVFMTGCGGTGKSYVIQSVMEVMPDRLKAQGLKGVIHVTALTGCAALLAKRPRSRGAFLARAEDARR